MARASGLKRLGALFLTSISLMAGTAGAQERFPAPPQWQPLAQIPHTEADTARTLAAAYYSLKRNLSATLMLSNQGPHSMDVRIRLFNLSGEAFDVPPVTFAGHEVKVFNLRDLVPPEATFAEGSLEVRFHGKNFELGGVLSLSDAARSLLFDEELTEPATALVSTRLEGVWWAPKPTAAWRLALANTTDEPLSATVRLDGVTPAQKAPVKVTLRPHETRILGLSRLLGTPIASTPRTGGVSILHPQTSGGLLARVFIEEPTLGYSDAADLADPGRALSPRLQGTGLRTQPVMGSPLRQVAVVRNASGRNVTVQGRIPYTTAAGEAGFLPLSSLRLAPREVREIDLADTFRKSGIGEIASAGLEFEHNGPAGNVLVKALAVSANGTHVFRVPLVDAVRASATGIYPWNLADGQSSFVYIKNATDAPRDYTMHLDFDGGPYVFGLKTVAARQTVVIDLLKIRDEQIPDLYGKTIPRGVTAGKAQWSMNGPQQHSLVGRLEQVNLAAGTSATAACGVCCPNSLLDAYMSPFSVSSYPGDSQLFTVYTSEVDCNGSPLPWYPSYSFFSSTNTAVATVTSNGFASAVGAGNTFIQSTVNGSDYYNCAAEAGNAEYCCDTHDVVIPCESECQVLPTVEIEVFKTPDQNDDLVRLMSTTPAKRFKIDARARKVGGPAQAATVVLTNPDGRLRFPSSTDTTKSLTLPANGDWVNFEISGETKSNVKNDAVIEAHCNSSTGPICGSEDATVFYFDSAKIDVTLGSNPVYGVYQDPNLPNDPGARVYWPPVDQAVYFSADATLKPSGLDCSSNPLKNLRIGIMQNAKTVRSVEFSNPTITWNPGVAIGTTVTVPTTIRFELNVPSYLNDSLANKAPLYDIPGQPNTYDSNSLTVPKGCMGGAAATSLDTPAQRFFDHLTEDAKTGRTIVGSLRYQFAKVVLGDMFRTWSVTFDTVTKEVVPLRERTWNLSADSTATTPQRPSIGAMDSAPANVPVEAAPFFNDKLKASSATRIPSMTTVVFTR